MTAQPQKMTSMMTKSLVRDREETASQDCKWLTNPTYANLNKIKILRFAQESGFSVPDTYIVNQKDFFISNEKEFISKSVYNPTITSWGKANRCMMYTTSITDDDIDNLPDSFIPSMVQELIHKRYEV